MNIQLILFNIILITSATSCVHKNNSDSTTTITTTVQQQKIEQIQLSERTRGFSKSIVLTPSLKTTNTNEDIVNAKVSTAEWKAVSKLAETLDLSKISDLKSPTTGRHSDRAMAASIIITSNGKEYTSSSFDSGHPPKELEALYNAINGTEKTKAQ
ncbi:hypothetical protein FW781_04120 (plasmid) [Chryseobacterium panacisoli]|uniref:Uncharacterized protein n=1 Tax=Chryseobacterium panacisoli TaxID=1807141 RepID=A0A5D8ZX06_9FLAO|nr:hypothetical protein [Chryseobacterium panacisoli]TZF99121.1 hypothetical protein FW781_04120 [Chryseobacterium panacisoli]